jgi:colanic acid/amylovoran biosynthesis glycosyltransferase
LRVAFVVSQFPSLSETFILRQATGLLDRGHEVDVFAYSSSQERLVHPDVEKYGLLQRTTYIGGGAPRYRLLRLMRRFGLLATRLRRHPVPVMGSLNPRRFGRRAVLLQTLDEVAPFLDRAPYDILHCQFGPLGELGLRLRDTGAFRGKLVTSFRGYDISSHVLSTGTGVYRDLFQRGDLFLCVSSFIKQKLIGLGCDERKIVVHRSGVETSGGRERSLRGGGTTRILTVARLVEKKGVEYGIRAVARILRERPDVEYRIAGDGPLRGRLENLVQELGVGGRIEILGWKTEHEVGALLDEADILLAPSVTAASGDEEGIPGAIMEAFAHAVPVVSTRHAGIPELVEDGRSGFLVPERDVQALAEKLGILIANPDLRLAMGEAGRRFVKEHHDIEKLNDRLVEIYRALLGGEPVSDTDRSLALAAAS